MGLNDFELAKRDQAARLNNQTDSNQQPRLSASAQSCGGRLDQSRTAIDRLARNASKVHAAPEIR
jgi:hypothetical protein